MEAAAGFAFTFGSFLETIVPQNPPTSPSIIESDNSISVRSDLMAQISITHRVSELDINEPPIVCPRATCRVVICNNDLIFRIDHVTKSLTERIQLGETVLGCPGGSAAIPYGLRNNSTAYSDQVRMSNLRITELDQSDLDQIQSDPPSSTEVGYQAAVFTLPPNRSNPDGRRQISVVSVDSESFTGEDDQQRVECLHRNGLCADRRANEQVILQVEEDLETPSVATPGLHGGVRHCQCDNPGFKG
jgi:hypothetical protein